MSQLKIGVVEDEVIIADNLCYVLQQIGYDVTEPAATYMEALEMIANEKPDLILLDIQIKGAKDGIDLAWKIKEDFDLPFIYLTANTDTATIERAKQTEPPCYLVKPFNRDDLYTAIEICIHNFSTHKNARKDKNELSVNDSIFIKDGNYFHKVKFDEILYLESENVYVNIYTTTKTLLVRSSMQQYIGNFDSKNFIRIHRSYVINVNHLQTINTENVLVNGVTLPLSKSYREELLGKLRLG